MPYAFTSSIKHEIQKFRQKNVQKNVIQVQSCCFVNLLYCLFLPFSLSSTSSLLKLPLDFNTTENILAFYVGPLYNYVLLTSLIELFHVTTDCNHHLVSQDLRKNFPLDRICLELDFRRLLLTLQPISHLSALAGSHISTAS